MKNQQIKGKRRYFIRTHKLFAPTDKNNTLSRHAY